MKKYFLILFVFTTISSFAQTDYSKVVMAKDADYKPAEKYALEASNFVLSSPLSTNEKERAAATAFLLKWMEGTPDYTYAIESPIITKLESENKGLTGVYLASLTKASLEGKVEEPEVAMVSGIKAVLAYSEKPANKVAPSETLTKLSELNKKGELEKLFK